MSTQSRFAYGRDIVDQDDEIRACPAVEAGYNPENGEATEPAEWYDGEVGTITGESVGIVDESMARDAWQKTIDHFRQLIDNSDDPGYYQEQYELACTIASELGWR